METYENTILKWIGYFLFLVVIAVNVFNIGGSNAGDEVVDAGSENEAAYCRNNQ